jgi:hypothetical protein
MKTKEYASPYLEDTDEDFGLDTKQQREERTEFLLKDSSLRLIEKHHKDYELYRVGDSKRGTYFAVSDDDLRYYMEYKENKNLLGRSVTQTAVWALDARAGLPTGFVTHVVFDILIPKFQILLSDSIQTRDGKRLWIGLMDRASRKGFIVGLINENTKERFVYNKHEGALPDWAQHTVKGWGKNIAYMPLRFFISALPI